MFTSENARVRRSRSRKICAKLVRKNCKIFRISARLRHKNACIRPACAAQTQERCCGPSMKQQCVQIRKGTRPTLRSRNFSPKFHEKNANYFSNFGAPRTKKMRAFARRALLELLNVAAAVYRVGCAFKAEKIAQSASTSRKVCAELARI